MLTVTTKMPDLIGLALLKEEVFRWLTPVPGVELVLGVEHGHKIFVWVMSHFLRYLKNLEVGFTCCHLHPLPPGVSLVSTSCPLHSLLTCIAPVCPFILPLPFIRRHDYHQPTAYIYIYKCIRRGQNLSHESGGASLWPSSIEKGWCPEELIEVSCEILGQLGLEELTYLTKTPCKVSKIAQRDVMCGVYSVVCDRLVMAPAPPSKHTGPPAPHAHEHGKRRTDWCSSVSSMLLFSPFN